MLQDYHHSSRGGGGGGGSSSDDDDVTEVREIHALTSPPQPSSFPLPPSRGGRSTSSSLSLGSSENFTTLSREFSAMVVAGATMQSDHSGTTASVDMAAANLDRIGEEEMLVEETNPLAIVPVSNPIPSPRRAAPASSHAPSGSDNSSSSHIHAAAMEEMSVHRVKKEEVESKIAAWQTAEIAKINNRFKREDVVINGWESERVDKASAWLKKVERKLDEQRARAVEKMMNDVAKARRKAEEKRASAEAKRGTKVAKVLELYNMLRAVGRAPSSKKSFF